MVLVRQPPHRAGDAELALVSASHPRRHVLRPLLVVAHRWAGLTIALFVAIAGLTGSAIAWQDALEGWTAPQLVQAPACHGGTATRDAVTLRAQALARHPGMNVTFLPLTTDPGRSLPMFVSWRPGSDPGWDELFVDPCSGRELGHRHWGDIGEGTVNLLPFVYRLHETLLLGPWGTIAMGAAALVWTFDCLVGLLLTVPLRRVTAEQAPSWGRRWAPAWRVRRGVRGHKLTFDLHRAGGLWVWPLLLVFAWSGVALALPQVYAPVMHAFGGADDETALAAMALPAPRLAPRLDFAAAHARGEALARAAARAQGVALRPDGDAWLWHVPTSGVYVYGFATADDVSAITPGSRVTFDSDTGAVRGVELAGTAATADRLTTWLEALHMARVFGWPWRLASTLVGLAVTMLSVTGVLIWTKKRSARVGARLRGRVRGGRLRTPRGPMAGNRS